jgi:hypothetical protein
MKKKIDLTFLLLIVVATFSTAQAIKEFNNKDNWQKDFVVNPSELNSIGENDFFNLNPGHQITLLGKDGRDFIKLVITVLKETKLVDGCTTRIVEEKETKNNVLIELSKNYYAIDPGTKDVYYFGENVDIYENDKIVSHKGSWESGKDGAKFGLIMPGKIQTGKRYYQEQAPRIAMDRAEIESINETVITPTMTYKNCIKIKVTTPIDPKTEEYKYYVKGLGLVQDGNLLKVKNRK